MSRQGGISEDIPAWIAKVDFSSRVKKSISIRLDPDILEFFRKDGKNYQSRINTVLRTYMDICERKSE